MGWEQDIDIEVMAERLHTFLVQTCGWVVQIQDWRAPNDDSYVDGADDARRCSAGARGRVRLRAYRAREARKDPPSAGSAAALA